MNTVSRRAEARQSEGRRERGDAEHQLLREGVAVELEDGIRQRREHDGERGHLDHHCRRAHGGQRVGGRRGRKARRRRGGAPRVVLDRQGPLLGGERVGGTKYNMERAGSLAR